MSGGRPNALKGLSSAELALTHLRVSKLVFELGMFKHEGLCDVAGCVAWTRDGVRRSTTSRGVHCCEQCRRRVRQHLDLVKTAGL